jgi:serine/threonine protein kinase/WD40 repeat protein
MAKQHPSEEEQPGGEVDAAPDVVRPQEPVPPPHDPSLADTWSLGTGDHPSTLPLHASTPGSSAHRQAGPARIAAYDIQCELGRGGMGVVYKAIDTRLDRIVALKTIRHTWVDSAAAVAMFHREAKAAAHLDHPGILPVYDVGEAEGVHFLTMPFIDGKNLAEACAGNRPDNQFAADITRQIADAVAYAHQHHVLHRDIKPQNVLIDAEGQVKVADFGLAKRLDQADGHTQTGDLRGTPSYMSPEQAAGRNQEIGFPSDVYAIGAVLYYLLTGQPPFGGEGTSEILLKVIGEEPVPPAKINESAAADLATICLKCLTKEPEGRYQSAGLLRDELDRYLAGESILARPAGYVERFARWRRRNPTLSRISLVAGCLAALLLIGGVFAAAKITRQAARTRQVAEQTNALQTLLESPSLFSSEIQRAEAINAELAELEPEFAGERQSRLIDAVIRSAQQQLETPRISAALQAEIQQQIDWLQQQNLPAAVPLADRLHERLSDWQTQVDLAALLDQSRSGNGLTYLQRAGSSLVSTYPPRAIGQPRIALLEQAPRTFRLQADFRGWDDALGIVLRPPGPDGNGNEIEFLIERGAPSSFASASIVLPFDQQREQVSFTDAWHVDLDPAVAVPHSCAFSPDGQYVVVPSSRTSLEILTASGGETVQRLPALNDAGFAVVFTSAQAETDQEPSATPEELPTAEVSPLRNRQYNLNLISIAPLRHTTFESDGSQRQTTQLAGTAARFLNLHQQRRLLAYYEANELHCLSWELPSQKRSRRVAEQVLMASFSPDGRSLVYATAAGEVFLWQIDTNQTTRLVQLQTPPRAVAMLADGATVVASSAEETRVFDAHSGWQLADQYRHYQLGRLVLDTKYNQNWHWTGGSSIECLNAALISLGAWNCAPSTRLSALAISPDRNHLVAIDARDGDVFAATVHREQPLPPADQPSAQQASDNRLPDSQPFLAKITRGGLTIRSQVIDLSAGEPVRLECRREGDQLSLRVNDSQPLIVQDCLLGSKLTGDALLLHLPAGTSIDSFALDSKNMPENPSLLERADLRYRAGDPGAALPLYRQQRQQSQRSEIARECDFKSALCLLDTNQRQAAVQQLESLTRGNKDKWARFALAKLWIESLRAGDSSAQELYFARISGEFDDHEFLPLLGERERQIIRNSIVKPGTNLSVTKLLRHDPTRVQRLQHSTRLLEFLCQDGTDFVAARQLLTTRISLARSLQFEGNQQAALPILRTLFETMVRPSGDRDEGVAWVTEEYSRLLRQLNQANVAEEIFHRASGLVTAPAARDMLEVEYGRICIAQGRFTTATTRLEGLVKSPQAQPHALLSAYLMLGAVYERLGQEQAAADHYRQGAERFQQWRRDAHRMALGDQFRGLMLAARAEQLEASTMLSMLTTAVDAGSKTVATSITEGLQSIATGPQLAASFTRAWQGPGAWDEFWLLATDAATFPDRFRIPLVRFAVELTDTLVFDQQATEQERQQVRLLMEEGWRGVVETGDLGLGFAVPISAAWKVPLMWTLNKAALPADNPLSARLCYVMGVRFANKGYQAQAKDAFTEAAKRALKIPKLLTLTQQRQQALGN